MNEKLKEEILVRLRKVGNNGLSLTDEKWEQLEAIDFAAKVLIDRRRKGVETIKRSELTVPNMERTLKELGGKTVTDQTMRNHDGLLEKFLYTYKEDDVSYYDAKDEIKRLKSQIKVLEHKNDLMEVRDAECEDAILEAEQLRQKNKDLERDKQEMAAELIKYKSKNKKGFGTVITEIDITKSTGNPS